ncbi:peptidase C14, caspase domain-containing protein [Armillaria borealis]|uniref:Peptidase C14, caspase domain-containing protein n=1 Tax=Armillaria borealis TaxID=47425 RepID=A0AA39IZZ2_9AGAR|nr:peptidase C14, caspase domain-containing protein [Armillaria borealis]
MDDVQLPKLETPTTQPKTSPKRKALIVAVKGSSVPGLLELRCPHRDAKKIKDLLIGVYHYTEVTMLLDDGDPSHDTTQPTYKNLMKHMKNLTQDIQSGDRLFFYFSGHAAQRKNLSGSEEDGMDEFLYTKSGNCIRDNTLRKYLVDNLPEGCHLTAVLDACHSGTLLDLAHHRCNRVLSPRRSNSWEIASTYTVTLPSGGQAQRRNAVDDLDIFYPLLTKSFLGVKTYSLYTNTVVLNNTSQASISTVLERYGSNICSDVLPKERILNETDRIYESPLSEMFCNGCCEISKKYSKKANVVCLSSCKDSQLTWEMDDGWSMTNVLIDLCKSNPHRTLQELMVKITQETEKATSRIHCQNQSLAIQARAWYEKSIKNGKPIPASEARRILDYLRQNFKQDPQLSSEPSPMDMPNVLWDP